MVEDQLASACRCPTQEVLVALLHKEAGVAQCQGVALHDAGFGGGATAIVNTFGGELDETAHLVVLVQRNRSNISVHPHDVDGLATAFTGDRHSLAGSQLNRLVLGYIACGRKSVRRREKRQFIIHSQRDDADQADLAITQHTGACAENVLRRIALDECAAGQVEAATHLQISVFLAAHIRSLGHIAIADQREVAGY